MVAETVQHDGALPAASPRRFEALDSLRGICAIAVAYFHLIFVTAGVDWSPLRGAWMFVDFFFVLSGFVIAWSYGDRLTNGYSVRDFMLLRLGRVYPLYIAVLLAMVAFEVVSHLFLHGAGAGHREAFTGTRTIGSLIGSVFAVQIFDIWPMLTWNIPGWSLAAEIWAYLIFALVCAFAGKVAYPIIAVLAVAMGLWMFAYGTLDASYTMGLPRCLYGFGAGVLLVRFRPNFGGTALELLAVALALGVVLFAQGWVTVLATPVFAFAVLVFSWERGLVSRLLQWRPFRLLGTLSYSLYITHYFVLNRIGDVAQLLDKHVPIMTACPGTDKRDCMSMAGANIALVPLAFLVAMLLAALLAHYLIEDPGRRWSRHWVKNASIRREEAVAAHAAF